MALTLQLIPVLDLQELREDGFCSIERPEHDKVSKGDQIIVDGKIKVVVVSVRPTDRGWKKYVLADARYVTTLPAPQPTKEEEAEYDRAAAYLNGSSHV